MFIAAAPSRRSVVVPLAATALVLALLPESLSRWLEFDRQALGNGELWRLWTAHLVHFSFQHALIDALVLGAAGFIVEKALGARATTWMLGAMAPAISIGLWCGSPELTHYRGLSGMATAMVVIAMMHLARQFPSSRPAITLLAVAMTLKVSGDALGHSPDMAGLPAGVAVEWRAHVLGALAAGVYFSTFTSLRPNSAERRLPRSCASASPLILPISNAPSPRRSTG
jgi:rhomboid family GlyGly-CTERM serine protease